MDAGAVRIEATVKVEARTGVEMEALTAVSIAALTVYDMCKAVDRRMVIDQVRLEEKTGGRSGRFLRDDGTSATDGAGGAYDRSRVGLRFRDGTAGSTVLERIGLSQLRAGQGSGGYQGGRDVLTIVVEAEETRQKLAAIYAPIAAELAEAERIFAAELGSRFAFVQQLVDHCADFRGKRLRPALVLLDRPGVRRA